MKGKCLQRTEGNAWYNILTCVFVLSLVFVIYVVVGLWSPEAAPTVSGLMLIPMGIFYLWFIGLRRSCTWVGHSGTLRVWNINSEAPHVTREASPTQQPTPRSDSSAVTWKDRTPVSNSVQLTMNGG